MNPRTERLVAIVALVGFVIFVGVLVWFVREIDLIVVVVIGVVLASYDFYGSLFRSNDQDT